MKKQEGVKPQLSLVPHEIPAAEISYPEQLIAIVNKLAAQKVRGDRINMGEVIALLDPLENNVIVRDWVSDNGVMPKSQFDKAIAKAARDLRIEAALGFLPTSAADFVRLYTEQHRIAVSPKGIIKRTRSFRWGNAVIDDDNAIQCDQTRQIHELANADGNDIGDLARELRIANDDLHLGYRDSSIGDAIAEWKKEMARIRKVEAFIDIAYEKGRATGPCGEQMWKDMVAACFDVAATCPGFAISVIRKFMWQVKRKAHNLPVTNHLMPVITGAQGKGKTQFVERMTAPLEDFKSGTDFGVITDNKTIDIWSSYILFLDEMGLLARADVSHVKNLITREYAPIRLMKQNDTAQVRNCATFIGCSNKSLGQLVYDDTGVRRFAELQFTPNPDYDAINAIDWIMLWKSVDERVSDPMVAMNMMHLLRAQQEENRTQHPVEVWVRHYGQNYRSWTSASTLHSAYRVWEAEAYPRDQTSLGAFGRVLTNIPVAAPDQNVEKKSDRNGAQYRIL